MPDKYTQAQLDSLAKFAGGTKPPPLFPHFLGPLTASCWAFPNGHVVDVCDWLPHLPGHAEQADLVLRALQKKEARGDDWLDIEIHGDQVVVCIAEHGIRCVADWWPDTVCQAALEIINETK